MVFLQAGERTVSIMFCMILILKTGRVGACRDCGWAFCARFQFVKLETPFCGEHGSSLRHFQYIIFDVKSVPLSLIPFLYACIS